MKLKTACTLVALACVGASASATTVDWGELGPFTVSAVPSVAAGDFQDVYTFTLTSASDVTEYDKAFGAEDSTITNGSVQLYSGTYGGTSTTVVSALDLSDTATAFTYSDLPVGSYYFLVSGTAAGDAGVYDINAIAEPPGSPSVIPEPANAALLLAGLGMMSIVFRRRHPR